MQILSDICQGVWYMHRMGVAHRDLKVENILLKDQRFRVADFGSAVTTDSFLIWKEIEQI